MKKNSLILFFLLYSIAGFSQQPTQAEIDKMMKQSQEQLKKMVGSDTSRDKMRKNLQDQQKQLQDQQKKLLEGMKNQPSNNKAATNGSLYADPSDYGNVDNWKFPVKNIALLSSLPKKIFTKSELVNFLNDIYSQLSKKFPAGITSSVQSIAAKYNNDGNKMGDAAVTGWYTNYREESLLLIVKAAANDPDNGLLLNNCAAILNMGGIEQIAIPILKYVLQSYPGSSMVLNNLGQAYAGLGETDTAMVYLGRCIKAEPENPEANNTAGQIEATKGNTEKAIGYFEQSIKGAYNKPAELKLRKIKKGSSIVPFVRPRVKLPDYFNLFKYDLPAQCTSTDNAAMALAEQNAFRNMISKQIQMFGAKYAEVTQMKLQEAMQIMHANGASRIVKKDEFLAQPFYGLCQIMAGDIFSDYMKDVSDFNPRVTKKYSTEMAVLENEYQSKHKELQDAGAGCAANNNLANQYLPKFAALTVDWQKKSMILYQKYFDELVYWHYLSLHPLGKYEFKIKYYEFIEQYLVMMGSICQTRIIDPCEPVTATASKDSNEIKEMECPFDIEIPFGFGNAELNCEKFSIKAGEGAVFGYEKNFKTHQSTVSVSIGLILELEAKVGPLKAGLSAEATETAFITFDGNNGIADFGLKNEAKVSAGATGVGKKEVSIGSTFGIHSGCNFNEGPFKGMIGPAPEVPLNKNVNIYKPK
jgi:tetratricopeptide (TPR) repeat protein